jgi:lysosomal alpha-mannosidase
MTVLNDRSQGGSSMADGSLEIMVHRRLLNDDAFGVGEALNETAYGKGLVIRGHHYMFFSAIKDAAKMHRDIGLKMYLRPMPSFSTLQSIPQDYYADYNTYFPGLTKDLPSNIHLLTLENWRDDQYLIRLEHLYQNNEDSVLSKPVTIQLKNMFTQFEIEDATEMTLGANQELSKASRLTFRTTDSNMNKIEGKDSLNGSFNRDNLSVTLYPMEIRTFVIKVKNTK